jgi:hypothetical protein
MASIKQKALGFREGDEIGYSGDPEKRSTGVFDGDT